MNRIKALLQSERSKSIIMAIGMVIMLVMLFVYLLNADLSTAPEFIYNQF